MYHNFFIYSLLLQEQHEFDLLESYPTQLWDNSVPLLEIDCGKVNFMGKPYFSVLMMLCTRTVLKQQKRNSTFKPSLEMEVVSKLDCHFESRIQNCMHAIIVSVRNISNKGRMRLEYK